MAVLSLTALGASLGARAASIETLLMPGKVSQAHVKQEETCSLCHDRADRHRQTALCLDCHKPIAADVAQHTGFHGRVPNIATAQCKGCHSEHQGRDADIVKLNRTSFDHHQSDFVLEGAHRNVACESCHKRDQAFRDAPSVCGNCHKADDVHKSQLSQKCGTCHNSITWAAAKFDHDTSKFPLREAHREVRCNACHIAGKYQDTPIKCVGCHLPDDAHRGSRGDDCGKCHTQSKWGTAKFDHFKETGFALLGRHNSIECGACHKSPRFDDKPPKTCVGCHHAEDSHATRFGEDCSKCHGNDHWDKVDYDHAKLAKFALTGAHTKLSCHTCHTAVQSKQKLGTECANCHHVEDPHGGALKGSCDTCHGSDAWKQDIRFDHDLTNFPLLGMHVLVTCAQCHNSKVFKGAPRECIGCHQSNDVHKGKFGKDCTACHTSNAWNVWAFDHSKTGFELSGAHGKLHCAQCHRKPAGEFKLAEDCASCHRKDDIHLGQYGAQCQRCHTTLSFRGARIL